MVALLIVALILFILDKAKELIQTEKIFKYDGFFKKLLWFTLLLTIVQVILGTQVRQFVDDQVKLLGHENIHLVMQDPIINFYIHRSFSIVVLATNIWLFVMNKQKGLGFAKTGWVLVLILLEVATGIAMYNFDFPFASQSIHIVTASLLFGVQFYMILESRRMKSSVR